MEQIRLAPQPGPQTQFAQSSADIVVYGGAAGGGKTYGLLLEPLRHIHNPKFGAVILRRTFTQVTQEGGMWDEARNIYGLIRGAEPKAGSLSWQFASGARVRFAHLQHEDTKYGYQGAQIALIMFDELTHFSESQFFYLLSRNRSASGVRPYCRATCNPDSESWVANLIAWWIDQDTGYPIPERSGVVRWFMRVENELVWGDSREDVLEKTKDYNPVGGAVRYDKQPKSFTFIPANIRDNQALLTKDPTYLANLMAQPLVERERLLGGNWKIKPAAGKLFNRTWFEIVEPHDVPAAGLCCRFFDLAASEKNMLRRDPDFTAAVKVLYVNNTWYILDVFAEQLAPLAADQAAKNMARQDAIIETGKPNFRRYIFRWEEEPGSAAIRESARWTLELSGLDALPERVPGQGDKVTRAKPFAAQCEMGNVKLVRGPWNEAFLAHMHHQPDIPHDDIMDATVGAWRNTLDDDAPIETGTLDMW